MSEIGRLSGFSLFQNLPNLNLPIVIICDWQINTEVSCSRIHTYTVPPRGQGGTSTSVLGMLHDLVIKGSREGQLKLIMINRQIRVGTGWCRLSSQP